MDAFRIQGGTPLVGALHVSGSKNATLPLMAATLLAPGTHQLHGVPDLADVHTLGRLLSSMGATVQFSAADAQLTLETSHIGHLEASYELVRTMRASILVLGPLLARFRRARVSLPGGCAIGARPIDQHLKGLERLGAQIVLAHGYVEAVAPQGLVGAEIVFDMPTVTGTENLMLAASLARGTTVLRNAAREPEIVDLAHALVAMGARIDGAGSADIVIEGQPELRPMQHRVLADRIECGTFLVAGALMGAPLTVRGGVAAHQAALLDKLRAAGSQIEVDGDALRVRRAERPQAVDLATAPFPGFPTDMQAQMMTLLAVAHGTSLVSETIFENRFMHVAELDRLGANIRVEGGKAIVHGVPSLSGSTVMATDLRASACLVLAGLVADGETLVRRIYHMDRGYEALERKLQGVGAQIVRAPDA